MVKENILWNHPENTESKGSSLLVHETTALNLDGNVPNVTLEEIVN